MKRVNTVLLTLALVATLSGMARADEDQRRYLQSDPRTDVNQTRPEAAGQAGLAPGEQAPLQLEAGLAAIETDYRTRLSALQSQLVSATPEQREALQVQMQSLKVEWTLAIANHQLELARARGDAIAIAQIEQSIQHITNPPQAQAQPVPRDPATGRALKGGAR